MPLNIARGNMYEFITHTWNTVKGACYHDCNYCYMKHWGPLKPVRLDKKEFKTDLESDNYIFVGSSCDMFAQDIPEEWIIDTLKYCGEFDNQYFFQTKNPERIRRILPSGSSVCMTLETNRFYKSIMNNSPAPDSRVAQFSLIRQPKYITIEPIMDFDMYEFVEMIKQCDPIQVNIGADSQGHGLPEPGKEKVLEFIERIREFTTVHNKKNLKRILS